MAVSSMFPLYKSHLPSDLLTIVWTQQSIFKHRLARHLGLGAEFDIYDYLLVVCLELPSVL